MKKSTIKAIRRDLARLENFDEGGKALPLYLAAQAVGLQVETVLDLVHRGAVPYRRVKGLLWMPSPAFESAVDRLRDEGAI